MYVWGSGVYLFTESCNLMPVNFYWLIHMWLVGSPQPMIPSFSIFHDGRELEYSPRG